MLGDTEQTDRDILRHFIARCGFRVQALLPQITAELNREDLITEVRKVFMNILSTRDPGVEFQDMVGRMRGISGLTEVDAFFDDVDLDGSKIEPAHL